MSLIRTQAIVTVTVPGHDLSNLADALRNALSRYEDARIVALTQKTNWLTSWLGTTALLAVIEYTPAPSES